MDKAKYTLIVSPGCPFCEKAILNLIQNRKNCEIIVLDAGSQGLNEAKELYDWHTVPIVVMWSDNEPTLIGGSDDLEVHLNGEEKT